MSSLTFGELDTVPDGHEDRREWLAGDGLSHLNEDTEMNVANRFASTDPTSGSVDRDPSMPRNLLVTSHETAQPHVRA